MDLKSPNNPDREARVFNERVGHWSLETEESFEKHLKSLAKGHGKHLWYGYQGIPFEATRKDKGQK